MPGRFDFETVTIGQLLDDPQARAIIDDTAPGVADNPMVSMVRGMSAESALKMAGDRVDAATVQTLRQRLAALS